MATAVKNATQKPIRFGKPSMTNLPYELGVRIMNTIMNSPKPDFTDTDREIAELEARILRDKAEAAKKTQGAQNG